MLDIRTNRLPALAASSGRERRDSEYSRRQHRRRLATAAVAVATLTSVSSAEFTTWTFQGSCNSDAYAYFPDSQSVSFRGPTYYEPSGHYGPAHHSTSAYSYDPFGYYGSAWASATLDITIRRGLIAFGSATSAGSQGGGSAGASNLLEVNFQSDFGDIGTISGSLGPGGSLTVSGSNGFFASYTGVFSESLTAGQGVHFTLLARDAASMGMGVPNSSSSFVVDIPASSAVPLSVGTLIISVRRRR